MKRNELLAKSLTLGLAVATAATSMSVPGGLLAPETVYAADEGETTANDSASKVTLSSQNVGAYFALSDQPIVAVTLNGSTVTKVNGPIIKGVQEGTSVIDGKLYGKLTTTFKDSDEKDVELNNLEVGKKYNAYINVDGNGTVLAAAAEPVKLGEVTVYEDLGDNAILTYKDGADDETGVSDPTNKEFKNEVVISVSDGATISTSPTVGTDTSVTISRGNIVSGSLPVALYVKKDDTTYAKIVTLNFAQKAAPSEMTGTASITTAQGEAISKLVIGDTVKAKYEGSDAKSLKYQWYRVPTEGEAEAIADATKETYIVTTADLGCTLKVVVSDADLSGIKNATTSVTVAKKDYKGEAPKFGESCFDEATRTLTATVAADTTAAQLEYSLDGGNTWTKGDATGSILSVEGTSAKLTLDAKAYAENTIKIRVAATVDTEASKEATYTTAIPRKGVDLSTATVKINDATETSFAYTGKDVIASVAVDGLKDTKYKVYYTDNTATAAGTNTVAPTAVGDYKLWIVPAEGAAEDCYGSKTVEFSIKAVKVTTTEDLKKYVDFGVIPTLTYNNQNQSDTVREKVTIKDDYAKDTTITSISFKKANADADVDMVGAGIYDVYVELAGNYETDKPLKIGTAEIKKYQPNVDDIVVLTQTQTYTGSKIDAEMKSCSYLLNGDNVNITYKQGGEDVVAPTNAGTYEIYVAYTGDDNCEALAATDKKSTLTIEKATDHSSFSPLVVKTDTEDSVAYDLTDAVAKWTLSGTDTKVTAAVKVDDAYVSYIEELKYADGKVSFKLSTAGKALPEQKEFAIHVDFGESFTNYNVAFDLPVIITNKTPVDISIKENVSNLTYDGKVKTISYEVKQGETSVEGAADKLKVTITKNGETVPEIKDAGTYVITAEYTDDTNYGKLVQEITVAPKKISTTDDLKKYFKIGDLNLTYDMTDHRDAIFDAVGIVEKSGIENNDYDVRIVGDTVNVGNSIAVSIKTWDGNFYTDDYVELGNVTISKGTITLKVTADAKGTPTITVGDRTIANDACELKYYDNAGKELAAKPTAPGTYKVKVTYTDEKNLTAPAEGEATFTISGGNTTGGSTSGGSSAGGGAATTPSKDDTKKDDTKKDTTTKTETKPDGTKVTTTETKAADGSVQTKIELKNDAAGVDATANVAKDAQGKVTGVTADVNQTATDKQTAISAATVAQITAAAGTKDVTITTKTVDANGKTVREVTVNASDLTAGKKLKVVAIDPKTGEKTLVNKTTYKVAADGSLALDNLGNDSYEVVTAAEVNALTKEILQSIRPERSKANIAAGKKTKLSLDDALNMDNVAKITYKTSKKSVATVNPNGTVTARKEGKVMIKAIVTLNNGKKKTVRMNLTVKARK
mgnify:CR=1 FL=1